MSPWGVIGLCLACFGYPLGTLQIAGHVARLTFSDERLRLCVRERLSSMERVGTEAKGGPWDHDGLVCGPYVYL